ncbi:hypothetical protein [Aquimarina mytili]|uniref:Uncharacterized protein n=1 Tax=Aquimarina mytili TaxID=874423 RepID=A0A937DB27_9FLAO|nr:hypothetical protein [Aquimarina mytili]MBL0683366.1 hypothetical protein [Aquimarina mytili]
MPLDNIISISFTSEELQEIDNAFNTIETIIKTKTVNLTPAERSKYGSIANRNKLLVDKAKNYMDQYPEWIPRPLDKEEFDRDYVTRDQIEKMIQQLHNYSQQLIDTKTLLDHDNYKNAISFYRLMKYLSTTNEPGAETVYNDMKTLFKNRFTRSKDRKK